MKGYGKELILDLGDCDPAAFNRITIREFFRSLCYEIDMEPCDHHFWDDLHTPDNEKETLPYLKGTSAIQFIRTSNITIHTLDLLKTVYINIFSCKDFDEVDAAKFSALWFDGKITRSTTVIRG